MWRPLPSGGRADGDAPPPSRHPGGRAAGHGFFRPAARRRPTSGLLRERTFSPAADPVPGRTVGPGCHQRPALSRGCQSGYDGQLCRRQARPDAAVGPSLYRGMPCGPHRHACQSPGRRPLLFPPSGRPCPDPAACHDGRELQEHLRAYPRHGRTPRHVRCRTSGRPGGAA